MRSYYDIGFAAFFGLVLTAGVVFAANIFDITYPIAELGGCESQSACKNYCDKPENADACQAFAEAKGLVKKEERQVVDEQKKGPGGCASKEDCRTYCDDPVHTEECIDFAEREGLMSKDTAMRARGAFKERVEPQEGPGGCKSEDDCRSYCDNDANFDECMKYAEEHKLMSKEEIERARKFRDKTGPGGCKGRECKDYCDESGHEEECLEFAEKEGLIPKEEVERARKFISASKDGGPGGCRGRQCENYCNDPVHRDECFDFAKKNNLISEDEITNIERGKKLEEKVREAGGPGGCKDEKSCMEYCKDPAHVEECLGFASAHGGMDRDTAERMLKQFVDDGERFGPRPVGRPGEFQPRQGEMEERFRKFEDFEKLEREFRGNAQFGPPPDGEGQPGMFSPGGPRENQGPPPDGERPGVPYRTGPGGCKTPDECMKYCFEHRDECGLKEPPPPEQRLPQREGEPQQRPDGRPFEGGEFRPEGRPFDGSPPTPDEQRFFGMPPPHGYQKDDGGFSPPDGDFQGSGEFIRPPEDRPQELMLSPEPVPTGDSGGFQQPPSPENHQLRSPVLRAIGTVLFSPVILFERVLR